LRSDKPFQSGLSVDESSDNLAIFGLTGFYYNRITVFYSGIDHRFTANADGKRPPISSLAGGKGIDLKSVDLATRLDPIGVAGGNIPHNWNIDDIEMVIAARFGILWEAKPEGAGLVGLPLEKTLPLQGAQVADDSIGAFEAKFVLNLANTGPETLLVGALLDERENLLLAESQILHGERKST
tara:strand:- start:10610 stop:11158 length:549 start_codon:yes stop_codon:yes gene_type:complete